MSWLTRLFRPHVELPPGYAQRLRAWRDQDSPGESIPLEQARFIMVDVETTGLDVRRDRVVSIGACAVEAQRLRVGERYENILQQGDVSERETILIHGIGPQAQAAGRPPEQVLMGFLEFVGKYPLVAFHAGFDQSMLDRELRATLGVRLPNAWIDAAQLAPALMPEARLARAALDEWLAYYKIQVRARHRAMDDAFATGAMFLILLKRARMSGLETVGSLLAAVEAHQRKVLGSGFVGA